MIPADILFSPLAIAGFVTGVAVAFLAGRVRGDPTNVIVMSAIGSGIALAGLAWANAYGAGSLFAACGRSATSDPDDRPSVERRGLARARPPARMHRSSQGARAGRAAPNPECYTS